MSIRHSWMTGPVFGLTLVLVHLHAAAQPHWAQSGMQQTAPVPGVDAQQSQNPVDILQEGIAKLQRFAAAGSSVDPRQARQFVETEIAPYFDFAYMARWAAGPMLRQGGPQQLQALEQQIKQDFLTTLARNLAGYGQHQLRFFPPQRGSGNEVDADVWLYPQQQRGFPTRLTFRFYYTPQGGWKVFDVVANGASAVSYYRQRFSRPGFPGGRSGPIGRVDSRGDTGRSVER